MCGRYHFDILPDKKGEQIKQKAAKLNLVYKQGDIFPGDKVLCIIPYGSKIDLSVKTWGIRTKSLLINARSENIQERPTFKHIKNNRCAILCNGFYEWDKKKNKYYMSFLEKYMYLACIYNENNELVIITKEAPKSFVSIHSRCPIIMNQEEMINYVHGKEIKIIDKELIIEKAIEEIEII